MSFKMKACFYLSILCFTSCHAESHSAVNINLPAGFTATVFAQLNTKSNTAPRMLAFDKNGNLFVTLKNTNQVLMLQDTNKDGLADNIKVVAENLNNPNGLAFVDGDLLIANEDGIVKLTKKNDQWQAPTPFISDLPTGGHALKSIKLGPDNYLYVNIGSSCNVCAEEDSTRATILRYTAEGKPAGAIPIVGRHSLPPIWASGLRNTQGFAWHPKTGAMFATNEGADNRSDSKNGKVNDDIPLEHLNKIEAGKHYGWPYCWGKNEQGQVQDPNFMGNAYFCKSTTPPAITFTSHSTPIGITFLDKSHFPADYKNDAIVALHGSWNRKEPSGYKLVRIKFNADKPIEVFDFATGWLSNNHVEGRPVDVIIGPDGALYLSEDQNGIIYRITYSHPQ